MGELVQFPSADNPFRERLEKAGQHVRDTHEAWQLALVSRNELVHEAVDQKYPQSAAARDLRVSRPSVTRILALPPRVAAAEEASAA